MFRGHSCGQAHYRRSCQLSENWPAWKVPPGWEEREKQTGRADLGCLSPGLQIDHSAAEEGSSAARHRARRWAGEQGASREACGSSPALTHASCILLGNSLENSSHPPSASCSPGAKFVSWLSLQSAGRAQPKMGGLNCPVGSQNMKEAWDSMCNSEKANFW